MTVLSSVASFFYAEPFAERHAEPLRFLSLVDSLGWALRGRAYSSTSCSCRAFVGLLTLTDYDYISLRMRVFCPTCKTLGLAPLQVQSGVIPKPTLGLDHDSPLVDCMMVRKA